MAKIAWPNHRGDIPHYPPSGLNTASSHFTRAWPSLFGSPLWSHGNVDAALALGVELNRALDHCEDRVVPADANARARVPLGAPLTHEDIAGDDVLAAEVLHTEAL